MMIDMTGFHDRDALAGRDDELRELRAAIAGMGGLAETALARAMEALQRHHDDGARAVVAGDKAIDAMELHAGELVAALIVRRAPDADELREILAAYRIAGLIERVGDYAKTIARRMPEADLAGAVAPMRLIATLGDGVRDLLRRALDAFAARDAEAAATVCGRDREIDALYDSVFAVLLQRMARSPKDVPACSQLLLITKSLERVGDQATNIAELVYHAATGQQLPDRHARPQG
jgi:phosphate transport system protein